MFKQLLATLLALLLVNLISQGTTYAAPVSGKETVTERVKESILKLGTGPDARVEVKLRDKTKLNGYVFEAGDESFVIVEGKDQIATTVVYSQVKQVKGNNLSTGAKIAIGFGIGIVILLFLLKDRINGY